MIDVDFVQYERMVIDALSEELKNKGVKTIESYSGQLKEQVMESSVIVFPAVYISLDNAKYRQNNRATECELTFLVLCADRNIKNIHDAALRASSVLNKVRSILHQRQILPYFTPFCVKEESVLTFEPALGVAVYSARYETKTLN